MGLLFLVFEFELFVFDCIVVGCFRACGFVWADLPGAGCFGVLQYRLWMAGLCRGAICLDSCLGLYVGLRVLTAIWWCCGD